MTNPSSAREHSIRLGTRGSALARWQAEWVAAQLRALGSTVELVPIVTTGDRNLQGPIGALGDRGVFTKEIQRALVDGRIDLAVHSLKDVPTDVVPDLAISATPPRAPVSDVLISRHSSQFSDLPQAARIGTGSLRRRAQLWHVRPDLELCDIRGNVDTRLRKLENGEFDAIVLAQAGLERLGLAARITEVLSSDVMLPAVGQGALGLETRSDDDATRDIVARLDDPATHAAVDAERSLLMTLGGGCLAPIAAWARIDADRLVLSVRVLSPNGREMLEDEDSTSPLEAIALGRRIAERLLSRGAGRLIDLARSV